MHNRPYHPHDLARLADITAKANLADPLTCFIRPYTAQYPLSYWQSCQRAVASAVAQPGVISFVAETEEGEVVGYAIWERKGDSPVGRNWRRGGKGIEASLLALRDKWCDFFRLDWSADYTRLKPAFAVLGKEWDTEVFAEGWELGGLIVAVEYQRRGIGLMLLRWGLEQAEAEGVPCCVQSSQVGVGFYEKAGFKAFEVSEFEGVDVRMPRMIWEPRGLEGRWFDRLRGKAVSVS